MLLNNLRHNPRHIVLNFLNQLVATSILNLKLATTIFDYYRRVLPMHRASKLMQSSCECLFNFRHTYFV